MLWLVPGLPVLAALAAVLPSRIARAAAPYAALAAVGASLAIALAAAVHGDAGTIRLDWLRSGELALGVALRGDRTGLFAASLVAAVALAILAYSLGYVQRSERPAFFAAVGAFTGAMQALTLADSLLLIFIAWELMGAASYLLIGFHRDDEPAQRAALKAFLITRTADAAMLAGVALAIVGAGSSELGRIFAWYAGSPPLAGVVAGLLLVGAAGKSGLLPFSTWLPDAMRGPAPVSALLHSATMVAAGAFLLVRLSPLFTASGILTAVAVLGLATALIASVAALAQRDLKRLLAYSTIAQVAEMVAATGLGAPLAALVFLAAHAGYKAALFLLAGRLQQLAGSTEMAVIARADPRRARPRLHALFVVAALALAGVPVSLAPSARDAVLEAGIAQGALATAALLTLTLLSGLYAGHAYRLTFGAGVPIDARPAPDDRPWLDAAPAALLGGVVLLGLASGPLAGGPLRQWLAAELPNTGAESSLGASAASIALAVGGILLGLRGYAARVSPRLRDGIARTLSLDAPARAVASAGRSASAALAAFDAWGPDRIGRTVAAVGTTLISRSGAFDRSTFDLAATRLAAGCAVVFERSAIADRTKVDRSFDAATEAILDLGDRWRRVQTGALEHYLVALGGWLVLVTGAAVAILVAGATRP